MNYYKQGDAANADKIKAAFEKLGIYVDGYDFGRKDVLFFTFKAKGNTYLMSSVLDTGLADIIKTHPDYQELELPTKHKFNVGDWIVHTDGSSIVPIQVYGIKNDRYLVSNILGSKGKVMLEWQDKWRLWTIQNAKDGDVLALNGKPFIYSHNKYGKNYCYIDDCEQFRASFNLVFEGNCVCPATKQERDLLFSKTREAGYEWDADKKELRKIQPHYDISNFHAGMPVLVRDSIKGAWKYVAFSHREGNRFCACGLYWYQCIPFNEKTKHLLGTTEMCPQEYINW